jgi:hypothetical protein
MTPPLIAKLVRYSAILLLAAVLAAGCGGDEESANSTSATAGAAVDGSAVRATAAQVEQTLEQAFGRIGDSTTTAELEAAVDKLQASADELALELDRTDAPPSAMQDKQALSALLRELSGRLTDVEAHVSQTPDLDAALQGEALVMLEPLKGEIEARTADLRQG